MRIALQTGILGSGWQALAAAVDKFEQIEREGLQPTVYSYTNLVHASARQDFSKGIRGPSAFGKPIWFRFV